ncbi:MAG: T9SS type A sorting domain-containing protein [Melioribacteraceae bacterium]|nr:T9SS type A sorting domain-containing protein [Melioribacteraceae bacterium]
MNYIIDTTTGKKTTFRYAGEPVTNNEWFSNMRGKTGGGAGFYIFSGPFDLAPRDTQRVMNVLIAARGNSKLNSITELKNRAAELNNLDYSELVKLTEVAIANTDKEIFPAQFELMQNYPNPFNSYTIIRFYIQYDSRVKIELFNTLGEKVSDLFNAVRKKGLYQIRINSDDLPSGTYFYRITAGVYMRTRKMIVLK